jgi:hypothetical protein
MCPDRFRLACEDAPRMSVSQRSISPAALARRHVQARRRCRPLGRDVVQRRQWIRDQVTHYLGLAAGGGLLLPLEAAPLNPGYGAPTPRLR